MIGGKRCVECKKNYALYWGNNFCEKCFNNILSGDNASNNRDVSTSLEKLRHIVQTKISNFKGDAEC